MKELELAQQKIAEINEALEMVEDSQRNMNRWIDLRKLSTNTDTDIDDDTIMESIKLLFGSDFALKGIIEEVSCSIIEKYRKQMNDYANDLGEILKNNK